MKKKQFERIAAKVSVIAVPQGGFITPHVQEIVGRKNLTIFKVWHFSRFYIMISASFQKIKTKNLNSDPCILNYWLSKH